MLTLRRSSDRGHFDHGWLNTHHTFSFADYYDPRHTGFRALRVINEDRVQPGQGFGTHGHQDMEIISCVLEGVLQHRDSLGNGSIIRPGELQRMSAGTGVLHSEFNPSDSELVHFYQIWLLPQRRALTPSYEQRAFDDGQQHGKLRLVASPTGQDGSLTIHQDAAVYLSKLDAGQQVTHDLAIGRHAWVQALRGNVNVNGQHLAAGDGLAVSDQPHLAISAAAPAEVMLFDLA
jgi:quercetin 2,3-dioxygenase